MLQKIIRVILVLLLSIRLSSIDIVASNITEISNNHRPLNQVIVNNKEQEVNSRSTVVDVESGEHDSNCMKEDCSSNRCNGYNYRLMVLAAIGFVLPVIASGYMLSEVTDIVNIKTTNSTRYGEYIGDFYYEEYSAAYDFSNNKGMIEGFISIAEGIINSTVFSINVGLLSSIINSLLNNITKDSLRTMSIVAREASPMISYLLSNSLISSYINYLAPAYVLDRDGCLKLGQGGGNASGARCVASKIMPYNMAYGLSVSSLVLKIVGTLPLGYTIFSQQSALNSYIKYIWGWSILTSIAKHSLGTIWRSVLLDSKYVCNKSFASNYYDFKVNCNRNDISMEKCCDLLMDDIGASGYQLDSLSIWSYALGIVIFILEGIALTVIASDNMII